MMIALHDPPRIDVGPKLAELLAILSRALRTEFGTDFRFFDGRTGDPLADCAAAECSEAAADVVATELSDRPRVRLIDTDRYQLSLPIHEPHGAKLVAVGALPALARTPEDQRQERGRLQSWLRLVHERMSAQTHRPAPPREEHSHRLQLSSSLEAILEINDLLSDLGVLDDSRGSQDRILARAATLLPVEALIWIPARTDEPVLTRGGCHLSEHDCRSLAKVLASSGERDASGCILVNHVASCRLDLQFPEVRNVMAIPVGGSVDSSWLVALNKTRLTDESALGGGAPATGAPRATRPTGSVESGAIVDAPFRRIDGALLMPFANLLACHSRMERRNSQVQELFTGLTNSLATAIDAKDSYTSGHSERVARVAVELGRELGLPEAELGDLYLGGLLHDIGKIGVRDSILFKVEPLTPEEYREVREHVHIGCRILSDFRAIAHLLPMVLHHHERYDGTGYPHGLLGEEIPLAARILAVADSYDAMTTSRSYRAALPRQQTEEILTRGAGVQWDRTVIDAFFRARERIESVELRGVGESVCFALDGSFR